MNQRLVHVGPGPQSVVIFIFYTGRMELPVELEALAATAQTIGDGGDALSTMANIKKERDKLRNNRKMQAYRERQSIKLELYFKQLSEAERTHVKRQQTSAASEQRKQRRHKKKAAILAATTALAVAAAAAASAAAAAESAAVAAEEAAEAALLALRLLREPERLDLWRVDRVYRCVQQATGSLGGNGSGGPIYGELRVGSMQQVADIMVSECNFGPSSRFVDVGSGRGKPNFHVAQSPGVRLSIGIEVEPIRYKVSRILVYFCSRNDLTFMFI